MFEELVVDQNSHWEGTLCEEGVGCEVLLIPLCPKLKHSVDKVAGFCYLTDYIRHMT